MRKQDIAIVGMSCIFPGADDIRTYWNNIVNNVVSIGEVPAGRLNKVHFDGASGSCDRFYCTRGGFIPPVSFNPLDYGILPIAVEGMEPDHLLTLHLVHQALEDAGLQDHSGHLFENTGIVIGKGNYAGVGATRAIEIVRTGEQIAQLLRDALPGLSETEIDTVKKEYQQKKGRFGADTVMGLIPNLVASLVANRLNLGGAAYTIDGACASSLLAVDHGVQELQSGRCDIMIAGGVHVGQNEAFWSIFTQLGALSKTGQIRPFHPQADGLLIGEGCGFMVLKRYKDALECRDRIYAVIKGVGVSSDGSGTSVMSPSVKGQVKAMEQAWAKAGLSPDQVGFIETHGTGTPLGDKTELDSLNQVFGAGTGSRVVLGAVKANIGHAMPAAGIAGLIKTALALYHHTLPPTFQAVDTLPLLNNSRFEFISGPRNWDESGLPGIAGVNAFGFGGINAHVVLAAAPAGRPSAGQKDPVLILARDSREQLLEALACGDGDIGSGRYRIAVFEPTSDRIEKAKKIVARDRPWRNRQDIWFTQEPLLAQGGKIAFLFPGLDGLPSGEVDSVAQYFNLPHAAPPGDTTNILDMALVQLHKSFILDKALKALGVAPDVNAGHSLGEWLAARSSGLATESSVISLLAMLDPDTFALDHVRFIAIGTGWSVLRPLTEDIADLYLTNDNCPSQVILCGSFEAIDQLTLLLRDRQLFYQILPFRSGFHSPFVAEKLDHMLAGLDNMVFQPTTIPLWSATTLEAYPSDHAAIRQLCVDHLLQPVRFRELTEKMYTSGIRMFIQVGSGGLIGFLDDTLKGKAYSALAANVPLRSGLQQLQRVMAALFVEGHAPEAAFLGIKGQQTRSDQLKTALNFDLPVVRHFPTLKKYAGLPPLEGRLQGDSAGVPMKHPLWSALAENMDEIRRVQEEMVQLFMEPGNGATAAPGLPQRDPGGYAPSNGTFQKELEVSLESHPYLRDHALLRQPENWHSVADMDPVIPMTMIFELFAEAAQEQRPYLQVSRISGTQVFQWMNVAKPFVETMKGVWTAPDTAHVSLERYGSAVIRLEKSLPRPPAVNIDIGTPLDIHTTPAKIYAEHMFHGPAYQGIKSVVSVASKGIQGVIQGRAGKGSLLDSAGQLFGLWLQLTLVKDRIAFPVKIKEINFYEDNRDQGGDFECTCMLSSMSDEFATADMVLKRGGKVWATLHGWQNRRLEIDEALWRVSMAPLYNRLSEEIEPGIFLFRQAYSRVVSWDFILKRYFNQQEKRVHAGLPPGRRKDWIISRVAVKDAVRALVLHRRQKPLFPIEFELGQEASGRPVVSGAFMDHIQVSLAHKDNFAVGVAALGNPVGIDMERIEARTDGFMELAFHDSERALMAGSDEAESGTRAWVAKEAYGKMKGLGLKGDPKRYLITQMEGGVLRIADTKIKTIKYQNYIIGWTL